jgi:hypothetical protein
MNDMPDMGGEAYTRVACRAWEDGDEFVDSLRRAGTRMARVGGIGWDWGAAFNYRDWTRERRNCDGQ